MTPPSAGNEICVRNRTASNLPTLARAASQSNRPNRSNSGTIAPNTFSSKASRGVAPRALVSNPHGSHWDTREILAWDPHRKAVNQNAR